MKIYHVQATIFVIPFCEECGDYHDAHGRRGFPDRTVKVNGDENDALKLAMQQERAERKEDYVEITLYGGGKTTIDFMREESEAELMEQIGAPMLNGFARETKSK